ncbi:radical SAM protein [bacterium]|nr:radical SAM protein [bacterium]
MRYPIDAVIAITYRCQAKCRMCSIWKITEHEDVSPDIYKRLPKTLRDVNISGGEPFLRDDLEEIVKTVHTRLPGSRIVVSSNGLLGESIVPRALKLKEIFPRIGFAFSVDGVGEMQDFIRGVEGAYEKVITAVKGVRDGGVSNIRIAYTLTSENPDHMIKVYRLAEELGVQFTMQVSHESDFFFGKNESSVIKDNPNEFNNEQLKKDFETIINGELSSYNLKRWGKAFIHYGSYLLAAEGRQLFSSRPGEDFFYLDPKGDIYPSVIHNYIMGNLADNSFDTVWKSEQSDSVRERCLNDKTPYWMGCLLRKALLEHKFQIGLWALKNKIFKIRL